MSKSIQTVILGILMISLTGCYTTGLSLRETGNFNYSNFIYGLYGNNANSVKENKNIKKPIKLAVAQVGENAPPKIMVDKLGEQNKLISMVSVIPVGGNSRNNYENDKVQSTKEFEERMVKMRLLAKDLGADYLFLFGGSSDIGEQQSWLGIMDFTIVGAFIIPTHNIVSEGRVSGALIDLETGRVVFIVSSQETKNGYATTGNLQGKQDQVLVTLRDSLVSSLTDQLIEKLATH